MVGDGVAPEASSSRQAQSTTDPACADNIVRPRGNTMSTLNSGTTVVASQASSSTARRKVRTVPPSAAFDPPTPPAESNPTFDTARRPVEPHKHGRRRRLRQYWSSGESSCSSDADDSSDDDEPPWWTFTQKGMAKIRAGIEGPARTPPGPETEAESGRERDSLRDRERRRRSLVHAFKTPSRQDSGETTPPGSRHTSTAARLFHPRPFSSTTSGLLRRASDQDALPTLAGLAAGVERTSSAPSGDVPPLVGTPEGGDTDFSPRMRSPEQSGGEATDPGPSANRGLRTRRLMSLPHRRHSHEPGDSLTDSEATMYASPRLRAKQRLFHLSALTSAVPEESADESHSTGNASPDTRRRRNANNLRIRLPPPLTHHFSSGWPHAGSWQDALRTGNLDDGIDQPRPRSTDLTISIPPAPKPEELTAAAQTPPKKTHQEQRPHSPRRRSVEFSHVSSPKRAKRKSKKTRRYRPAQAPPTPGEVVYMPDGTEAGGRIFGSERWGTNAAPAPDPNTNPFDRLNPFDRINEEYALSPQQSRISEKSSSLGKGRWGRHKLFGARRSDLRRTLFLDARVTIYIRFLNLAFSVTLLALAVRIRQEVGNLGLRGIIGPSTTLIISYASLTIVHGLTAMYREYFGRPIGLWGLRSKMLWVCLDLLFIALWASASTLAINDYIDTPLDCTPSTPWWSTGTEYYTTSRVAGVSKIATLNAPGNIFTDTLVPEATKYSPAARAVCRKQIGCFAVSIIALLLYCGNMVLSLFRIFETVRRTSNAARRISV